MPSIGDVKGTGDFIEVVSTNGIDLGNEQALEIGNGNEINNGYGSIDNGNLTSRLQELNNIPEKSISVEELIMNMARSGNVQQIKLASDLLDLNLAQGNGSENLGPDCFDKISASDNLMSRNVGPKSARINTEHDNNAGNENNCKKSDMEWTTVKPKHKRNRSGSSDSEKIRLETSVSPNKKHKSGEENVRKNRKIQGNSGRKTENIERTPLNKDSVLVIITDIPDNTYLNSIRMENMILAACPRLKESGMWTKYRVNKRHKNKCYITFPKEHYNENVSDIIKS